MGDEGGGWLAEEGGYEAQQGDEERFGAPCLCFEKFRSAESSRSSFLFEQKRVSRMSKLGLGKYGGLAV